VIALTKVEEGSEMSDDYSGSKADVITTEN